MRLVTVILAAIIVLSTWAAWGVATSSAAELYIYTDASGSIMLTDKPRLEKESYATARSWSASPLHEYQRTIKSVSARYRVDPKLVTALISTESNFNELAVSRSGAMGLMQLMPETAAHLGVKNPFNPKENIEGGVKYLGYLIKRFNGKIELAVAAYNCGPTAVEKYGKIPPYGETRRYVKKVFDRYYGRQSMYTPLTQQREVRKIVRPDGRIMYTNVTLRSDQARR